MGAFLVRLHISRRRRSAYFDRRGDCAGTLAIIRKIPAATLMKMAVFGATWGVSLVLFGLSISIVGVAITFAVCLGTSAASGALIPLLISASRSTADSPRRPDSGRDFRDTCRRRLCGLPVTAETGRF